MGQCAPLCVFVVCFFVPIASVVNQPSPAIVAQAGVRRLPRWSLLLFCVIYTLAGFVWRDPWRGDDITSFGYMLELAHGRAPWLAPGILGEPASFHALLPYWLGAWAIRLAPGWISASLAVRLVFMGVLLLTLLCCWYGIYYLNPPWYSPSSLSMYGSIRFFIIDANIL